VNGDPSRTVVRELPTWATCCLPGELDTYRPKRHGRLRLEPAIAPS
jgi:hypothetical protein